MSDTRADVGLYLLALATALLVGPGAPVYWDSFGYVTQSLSGHVGGLLLGRPLFILASHALVGLFRSTGGSVRSVEPLLRFTWCAFSVLAAPLTARLARSLGHGPSAARWAGAATALSPAFAHTADAVLTDAPSMAAAVLAFLLAVRAASTARAATAFSAGLALGVAIGLREQAVLHAVPLALLLPSAPRSARARLALAATAGAVISTTAPVAFVLATQPGYPATVTAWFHAMARERVGHAWGARDAGMYLVWVLSLGPAAVAAAVALVTSPSRRALAPRGATLATFALCAPAAVQLLLLGGYQDIAYSPRYLLAAFPGAVALPAGLALAQWSRTRGRTLAAVLALALPALLAAPVLHARQRALIDGVRDLPGRLATVPADAAVVTGQLCPAVVYVRTLARAEPARYPGATPSWQQVCPGWRWPEDLASTLDAVRAQGRTVVLDLRETSWVGPRQRRAMAQARDYAARHASAPGVRVWR